MERVNNILSWMVKLNTLMVSWMVKHCTLMVSWMVKHCRLMVSWMVKQNTLMVSWMVKHNTLMVSWMLKHNTLMVMYTAAAFAMMMIIIALFRMYKRLCCGKNSHNNSSARNGIGMPQSLIKFSVEELKQATNNFGESNLIGFGSLGQVYNGLIGDMTVTIKMLPDLLHPRFLAEATYLSKIRHCNVVNLVGYCCENGYQMLVYEYLANGSVRSHLQDSVGLKFKKRIYIALGAAKGLKYLHSLSPPLSHNRFKITKVLLDADFNAKVSDAGLSKLLENRDDYLRNPTTGLDETTDVYSFGLFLLELVTVEEPKVLTSNAELIQWMGQRMCSNTFLDKRMYGTFTKEALKDVMILMLKCLKFPAISRPKMEEVVTELEKIYQKDLPGEDTILTLGSDLFTMTA